MAILLAMRLILVTVDGVRPEDVWSGIAAGELPALAQLTARGVGLAGIAASGPQHLSLPGYREILTGRAGGSCRSNECPPIDEPTLLDALDGVVVVASWETYENAFASGRAAVSAGRHGGRTREQLRARGGAWLDRGAAADAWPGKWDYRPDAITAQLAIAVAPEAQVLVVGLGDTDEHAHRGDLGGYRAALRAADRSVGQLVALADPDTLVVVTTDHGRSRNFRDHGSEAESAPVWLIAAGGPIPRRGLVHTLGRRLCDLAPTLRALMGLSPDASPRAGQPIDELLPARLLAQGAMKR